MRLHFIKGPSAEGGQTADVTASTLSKASAPAQTATAAKRRANKDTKLDGQQRQQMASVLEAASHTATPMAA